MILTSKSLQTFETRSTLSEALCQAHFVFGSAHPTLLHILAMLHSMFHVFFELVITCKYRCIFFIISDLYCFGPLRFCFYHIQIRFSLCFTGYLGLWHYLQDLAPYTYIFIIDCLFVRLFRSFIAFSYILDSTIRIYSFREFQGPSLSLSKLNLSF